VADGQVHVDIGLHTTLYPFFLTLLSMSSSSILRPLAVIAGIGNGAGTGAASA